MPLHKKGSTFNMNNYQPISLLSVFSKIYEKIMYVRLYQFLEKSQLFYSLQFGFRAKHSTNHALISITETIKESIDNNKLGCGVFLDLRKAFDTVNPLQHFYRRIVTLITRRCEVKFFRNQFAFIFADIFNNNVD